MASLAAAGAWLAANAGTIGTIGALGAAGAGSYMNYKTQEEANKQLKKQFARNASKPPETATEQKKIDAAAKTRDAIQSNMLAGARKGSTATGGTTLG